MWLRHRRRCAGHTWEVDEFLIPTGYERTLPPGVQLAVRSRRREMAARARGRVLDLGGADSHRGIWGDQPDVDDVVLLDGPGDPQLLALTRDDTFDTVFSVFGFVSAPDLDATVRRVREVLAADGDVLFLEPARRAGFTGRVQRAIAPGLALGTGWRIDRDIPRSLRDGGLSVVDVDRFTMATTQWWMRVGVQGRAHHALPLHRPDPT